MEEILQLMAEDKTNQEIAKILDITSGTVRVHIHTILQKLNIGVQLRCAFGIAIKLS